ncbi:AfsR/SARP family transcriptional regulator [Micromonospora avicenniae]|uniref:AfsR/SARP family transcriptional regulator n=1 Tax=Micromonospora avicenniae TaxID=1198245 RepID=UPI00332CBE1D
MSGTVRFEILGPQRAWYDERELDLGPGKQRAVLAVLLLTPGRPVPTAQIVDAVWPDDPPANGSNVVQKYVAGLRRVLEPERSPRSPGQVLTLTDAGYVLRVPPESVDAVRFERTVRRARRLRSEGQVADAVAALRSALDLWRGEPLAGLPGSIVDSARHRLVELRAAALETRAELELEQGRHRELVGELVEMVAEFPLREGLRYQLMLALHRSGRQAEALAAYREYGGLLREEFGIEPGEELQDLHRRMLRADTTLMSSIPSEFSATIAAPDGGPAADAPVPPASGPAAPAPAAASPPASVAPDPVPVAAGPAVPVPAAAAPVPPAAATAVPTRLPPTGPAESAIGAPAPPSVGYASTPPGATWPAAVPLPPPVAGLTAGPPPSPHTGGAGYPPPVPFPPGTRPARPGRPQSVPRWLSVGATIIGALTAMLSFGLLTWVVVLVYAAWRRSWRNGLAAPAYLLFAVTFVLVLGSGDPDDVSDAEGFLIVAWLGGWVLGVVHTILLNGRIWSALTARAGGAAAPVPDERRIRREHARHLLHHYPPARDELRIGRPDLPRTFDDGGLIDVNAVPEQVLAALPGLTADQCRHIAVDRWLHGPYTSLEDLAVRCMLPPNLTEPLRDLLLFLPPAPAR